MFVDEQNLQKRRDNIEEAIKLLHRKDRLEWTLLSALKKYPNDYFNAFTSISRNIRFIYIHAYQSYVWNRAVSERLRKFGKKVLIGDMVIKYNSCNILSDNIKTFEENSSTEKEVSNEIKNL